MKRHRWLATDNANSPSRRAGIGGCLVGALVLGLGLNGAAFGASNMGADCDHSARGFMRPTTDPSELSLSVVDLTDSEEKTVISAPSESVSDYGDSAAPLLFLTPRVESIVDDVFADGVNNLSEESEADNPASMTPLAESVDDTIAPPAESIDNSQPLDLRRLLPSVQQQMYRTDI